MTLKDKFHEELKNFIVSTSWTHKIHAKYSDFLSCLSIVLKTIQIGGSALTSSGVIAIITKEGSFWFKIGVAILSCITVFVSAIDRNLKLEEKLLKEKAITNEFYRLKEKALRLLYQIHYDKSPNYIIIEKEFNMLFNRKLEFGSKLSNVPDFVVNKARNSLKEKRDNDYTDDYSYCIPKELLTNNNIQNKRKDD